MSKSQIARMAHRIAAKFASTAGQAVALALTMFVVLAPAYAEGVTIESDDPAQSIKLEVEGATIRDVLEAIRDKYGIELAADDEAGTNDPVTATFEGSLPVILERLLRNQNYMIVRSEKNVTGVEKILIAAPDLSKGKKPPAAPEEPTPMP